ncbi:MAG: Stk1 family PASTA domain-containing Ser/Thr kinase [Nocardioidaceae bacterium]
MAGGSSESLRHRLLDGRYLITDRIARGGMATVYTATDVRLDRLVAIKIMHEGLGSDDDFADRFVREARAAARLNHPNVVAVFDQGDDDGTVYLVMEYVPGTTLRDVIRKEAPLAPRRALAVLEQIVTALSAAHEAGLVHRDIKPENVLIPPTGLLKVADFGLARAVTSTTAPTATAGMLMGTVSYVAPELVLHTGTDARCDVYACGVLLYEMLTGVKPHEADTPIQVAYKHVHDDVPLPSGAQPGIPPYVDALVARATARDRDLRPTDAGVLLRQVRRVAATLDAGVVDDPDLTTDLMPRRTVPDEVADHAWAAAGLAGSGTPEAEHTLVVDPPGRGGRPELPRPTAATPAPRGELPPRRRRGPVLLAVLLVLALAAGVGGWYLGVGRYTHTPKVVGLTRAEAGATLDQAGLSMTVVRGGYSETAPAGTVLSTDPAAGDRVQRGGTVTVLLSRGKERFAVPSVVGMPLADAEQAITDAHLVVGETVQRFSGQYAQGVVMKSSYLVGALVKPRTVIVLTVSKGMVPVPVPDLEGMPAKQARQRLVGLGFRVTGSADFSDSVPAGSVVTQTPHRGELHRGDEVALVVSKGPQRVDVPSVIASPVADATATLRALGFKVDVLQSANSLGLGLVATQSPGAGSSAPYGATITLYLV